MNGKKARDLRRLAVNGTTIAAIHGEITDRPMVAFKHYLAGGPFIPGANFIMGKRPARGWRLDTRSRRPWYKALKAQYRKSMAA